jgi:hypothetical protein
VLVVAVVVRLLVSLLNSKFLVQVVLVAVVQVELPQAALELAEL